VLIGKLERKAEEGSGERETGEAGRKLSVVRIGGCK
jgi:hypothetical protein